MHFIHTVVSAREMVNNGKNLKQRSENMKGTIKLLSEGKRNHNVSWKVPIILIVVVNLVLTTFVFSALQYTVYDRAFRTVEILIKVTRKNKATVATV